MRSMETMPAKMTSSVAMSTSALFFPDHSINLASMSGFLGQGEGRDGGQRFHEVVRVDSEARSVANGV
jgi:hypothetical protein